jgi:hypothetical protein
MKLNDITVAQYIEYYFAETKPEGWEQLGEELSNIIEPDNYGQRLSLYKQWLTLRLKKTLNDIDGKSNTRNDILEKRLIATIERLTQGGNSEYTEEHFTEWIVEVGKWAGYHIDRDKTTMLEFAVMTKNMDKERQAQIRAIKNQKR